MDSLSEVVPHDYITTTLGEIGQKGQEQLSKLSQISSDSLKTVGENYISMFDMITGESSQEAARELTEENFKKCEALLLAFTGRPKD